MLAVKGAGVTDIGVDQVPLVERVVEEGRDRPIRIDWCKRKLEVGGYIFVRHGLRRE